MRKATALLVLLLSLLALAAPHWGRAQQQRASRTSGSTRRAGRAATFETMQPEPLPRPRPGRGPAHTTLIEAAGATVGVASGAARAQSDQPQYVPNQVLIKLSD
ncbi:MAG TPA: hypothetical protein VF525_10955, partial [Pyrinomonadaceae bacterium]